MTRLSGAVSASAGRDLIDVYARLVYKGTKITAYFVDIRLKAYDVPGLLPRYRDGA